MIDHINWWDNPEFKDATIARPTYPARWDEFFMTIAKEYASMSKCASRKVGAIIVRGKNILSAGYNGSPAGSSLCQNAGFCPRKKLGYKSGEGIEYCPAVHAECGAILNAAKHGIMTIGAIMYAYCGIPCLRCSGQIINAGIKEIVCLPEELQYDNMAKLLLDQAGVIIRYVKA